MGGRPTHPSGTMRRRDVLCAGGAALAAGTPSIRAASANREFEPLGRLAIPGAKELVVDDDVGYVATTDGFATVDLSAPSDPETLARRDGVLAEHPDGPLAGIYDGKLGGDYYAIGGPVEELRGVLYAAVVYDVSDPADPEVVLEYETDFYHHNLDTDGGTLYLCGNDGDRNPLICVDVDTGEELGRWSVVDAVPAWGDVNHHLRMLHDVWVEDGIAYCAYWNAGTWLVDVSDPTAPTPIADVRGLDPETQADYGANEIGEPVFSLPGNDHFAMPARERESDGHLFAINEEAWALEEDAGDDALGGVELWRVADGERERLARIEAPPTEDPTRSGVWTTAHNFDFVGDRLYTSWYRGGVRVHDVSDPSDPREIAAWRDDGAASFWTAQLGRRGEYFAASSWQDPGADDPDAEAAIYTFPDPDGSTETPEIDPEEQRGVGFLVGTAALGMAGVAAWRRLILSDVIP